MECVEYLVHYVLYGCDILDHQNSRCNTVLRTQRLVEARNYVTTVKETLAEDTRPREYGLGLIIKDKHFPEDFRQRDRCSVAES